MTQEEQGTTEGTEGEGAMADDLFTLTEAKNYLGVALNTIKLYALQGRLPYIETTGGTKLFRRGDLEQILPIIEQNRRQPGSKKREEGE